jgi:cell wall-associated NlpC family hydrolase
MLGICHLSLIPVRKEPADQSEMVSQLLFGEHYRIIKSEEKWLQVKSAHDGYTGWIDKKQWHSLSQKSFDKLEQKQAPLTGELAAPVLFKQSNTVLPVLMGSSVPEIPELQCNYGGELITKPTKKQLRHQLVEHAFVYLNSPYLWGGRSPFGIDCSGFTQLVYKLCGIALPRDAWQQAETGSALSFIEEAKEGDLAFFDNKEGKIIHVGILLNNNQIIHASGKVRIDKIDHQGIFNKEIRGYTHHLRILKKVIND